MRTWPAKFFLFILFFSGLWFFKPFQAEVFAQSAPFVCPALGVGWQADIALRGDSWHHRAAMKNETVEVAAAVLSPGGSWIKPDLLSYGDTSGYSDPGGQATYHAWSGKGSYTITLIYYGCLFSRTIYISDSSEYLGNVNLTEINDYFEVIRPGKQICGTLAGYYQQANSMLMPPVPNNNIDFSMPSLGGDPNAYCGQPGGMPFAPGLASTLATGQSRTPGTASYTVVYPLAGKDVDTANFQLSADPTITGKWDIASLNLYYDCKPNHPPDPTPTPDCPRTIDGHVYTTCSGVQVGSKDAAITVTMQEINGGPYINQRSTVSDANGNWSINMPGDAYHIRIIETANGPGTVDSATLPDVPSAACAGTSLSKTSVNQIDWYDVPCSSCTGFNFYDTGCYTTPTPTPVPVNCCVGTGYCTDGVSQSGWNQRGGMTNSYATRYVEFTAPFTGMVDAVGVFGGNYGNGGWVNHYVCKVTNTSNVDVSPHEASSNDFNNADGEKWWLASYQGAGNTFQVNQSTKYRLWCRQYYTNFGDPTPPANSGQLYWDWDTSKAATDGRTYCICMCQTTPTPSLIPTLTPSPTATPAPLCPACPASVTLSGVVRTGEPDKYNVSIRWSASPNATGYKIYRCQGAGCAKPASALTSVGVGVTSYVDTNSNNGFDCVTNLSYWIEPTKAGCSEPGCARSNIILSACVPCVPACPVLGDPSTFYPPNAFRATTNSITLRWTISSWGTVCSPLVQRNHFTIYVSTNANDGNPAGTLNNSSGLLPGFSPLGKDVGTNTSETINNLIEGQWYYWQVKAENRD